MKIGILGGSFDPIHYAHLLMAECALEQLQLDEIRFIPAAQSPLKQERPPIKANHRLEMVKLAIGGHPKFTVDDREIRRTGISYTVDTLEQFAAEEPDTEFMLIVGGDSLDDFTRWKAPARICELATLAIVDRAGLAAPDVQLLACFTTKAKLSRIKECLIHMPLTQFSSSEIRLRVANNLSIRYRTPPAVMAYITAHRIYESRN